MIEDIAYIGLALVLLSFGAEGLVKGSAALALRLGLSPLVVGLTIVSFGTSSPELVVSIQAGLSQQGDVAVGNVVGSNIFNIAVILGITALVCPIPVHRQIIKVDAPIALGVALTLVLFALDDSLVFIESGLLLMGFVAYLWMNITLARRQRIPTAPDTRNPPSATSSRHWAMDLMIILGGLVVLVIGSRLLVKHSVSMAKDIGISEAVIGLTIVAAGTSMPELATSLVAAVRKQPDIAIGNVVGSNIFNILGILGLASFISPLSASGISTVDYAVMIMVTVLLIPLLYTGRLLHRLEGVALLLLYGFYLFLIWPI